MQIWKKLLLLLLVLLPSAFFLSKAFSSNTIYVNDAALVIKGAGGTEIPLQEIESVEQAEELPEIDGTGGFSLGLIKKGNFIRSSDQKKIRIVRNSDGPFIHLITQEGEVYFNAESAEATDNLFRQLKAKVA